MSRQLPTRDLEAAALAAGHQVIAFVDEVGRGAGAGPVCVGVLIPGPGDPPANVADSKTITPRARARLAPLVAAWARGWAVGQADAAEIDRWGMSAALRLATHRALATLPTVDLVILDGPHDYVGTPYLVHPHVKADLRELGVAAASILAKVHRDQLMVDLADQYPHYGFDRNAGYLTASHRAAVAAHGPTPAHRTTWSYMDDLPQWEHLRRHR